MWAKRSEEDSFCKDNDRVSEDVDCTTEKSVNLRKCKNELNEHV